ncbi:MAG: hypothetical protein AAGC74_00110 [Verrucomicrobiota bacterium]
MTIVWTEQQWLLPGLIALAVIAIALILSYWKNPSMPVGHRFLAASLKWTGFALLLVFLLQPEVVTSFIRPGTNHWAILLDNSASMTLKDQKNERSRADTLQELFPAEPASWQESLAKDFLVDSYTYDVRLQQNDPDTPLSFEGPRSALGKALNDLHDRYQGRPLAGILVLTDGSPSDSLANLKDLPPTFPLVIEPEEPLRDLSVSKVTAQATLFEDAPLIVDATISAQGLKDQKFVASIHELNGKKLDEQSQTITSDEANLNIRFQVRPEASGTAFFKVEVARAQANDQKEATLENNSRLVAANRETGPYRVLYLGGRPNFEHKFLQRALEDDPAIRLTSLIRIARREPKFDYRSRKGERSNPLYRGFEQQEEAERFDEAVFIRLKTKDANELVGGFPRTTAELFPFDTVILDDIEAAFFDRDQLRLVQRFVSERGGSVLMLGGMESLDVGGYQGTPIGEMLPVYLEPETPSGGPTSGRFQLTREGRLEPWARLRKTEEEEARRIQEMPKFNSIHRLANIRPGAMEIGLFETPEGTSPALVTRRYGRGHTAILGTVDLWKWGLKNPDARADMNKTWRQLTRWLLSDVPRPLSLAIENKTTTTDGPTITTELLGSDFQPHESGTLKLRIQRPDNSWIHLNPRPHMSQPGISEAHYNPTEPGTYLVEASTRATDDLPAQTVQAGWVTNALQDEYLATRPKMAAMTQLASSTGGEVLTPGDLDKFVANLKNLPLPVTETRSEPFWHHSLWLIAALACFIGEWSLRRWKKLP